jgi:hypothetical protein
VTYVDVTPSDWFSGAEMKFNMTVTSSPPDIFDIKVFKNPTGQLVFGDTGAIASATGKPISSQTVGTFLFVAWDS